MSNYYDTFDPEDAVTMEVPNAVFKQAIVEVGETTTGEPGTDAAVDNTGTETHAVLHFTIPRGAKGENGVSPTVTIIRNQGDTGYLLTITDAEGVHTAEIQDGQAGARGEDGFSPTVSVSKSGTTTTITITDKTSEHTATIEDGEPGLKGDDGVSPTVTIARNQEDTGNILTITDGTGAHTATIPDGAKGPKGDAGVSPSVTIIRNQADTGYVLTITDATGAYTANIPDGATGQQGPAGQGVPAGGATGAFLVKNSGTDYDTTWQTLNNADATGY